MLLAAVDVRGIIKNAAVHKHPHSSLFTLQPKKNERKVFANFVDCGTRYLCPQVLDKMIGVVVARQDGQLGKP
jgi:hypothetical protein